jgi:2-polyprenyl-6-methoxyphenol hydroxylase and related FAD-dependent oxidoreductases
MNQSLVVRAGSMVPALLKRLTVPRRGSTRQRSTEQQSTPHLVLQPTIRLDQHAIVIGGSVAGLLASQVLARHFETVTILEKDRLPETPKARRGVPQAQHSHVLLQRGCEIIAELFGASGFDFEQAGTIWTDVARDVKWYQFEVWKKRFESGSWGRWCDRTKFEHYLRTRVLSLPNVSVLEYSRVTELLIDGGRSRVLGVRIGSRARGVQTRKLQANLIVDASGRGSKAPHWLENIGFMRPREQTVEINIGYASRLYRKPPDFAHDWTVLVIHPAPPASRRSGLLYPLNTEIWMVTLNGWCGDHPPAEEAGFLEFAKSLPADELYQCIKDAEPLSPVFTHEILSNRWRRYDRMHRFPEGFVVVGDAVCSLNPVYGQGITVSALDALMLQRSLEELRRAGQTIQTKGFARQLQRKLADNRPNAWMLAASFDFRFPETKGKRPWGIGLLNWYIKQVLQLSSVSSGIYQRFLKVLGLQKRPAALFHPAVLFEVIKWVLGMRSRSA